MTEKSALINNLGRRLVLENPLVLNLIIHDNASIKNFGLFQDMGSIPVGRRVEVKIEKEGE